VRNTCDAPTAGAAQSSNGAAVVEVTNLSVRYGELEAVRSISFTVGRGEIVGLVGPNGAGKTSVVETVGGLRSAVSGGVVRTCGLDPQRSGRQLAGKVGMQLQESSFPSRARVGELCDLYERIYRRPRAAAPLLAQFGLADRRPSPITALSSGMRQRLALILAQIGKAELVILDELATGLDPEQRQSTWHAIRDLGDRGVSILLTSHYMDEVEALCARVGVIVAGRLVRLARPSELIGSDGGDSTFSVDVAELSEGQIAAIRELNLREKPRPRPDRVEFAGVFPADYELLTARLRQLGIAQAAVRYRSPSLEDAYVNIVNGAAGKEGR
jgi:ABC-2 type transport system ATP-binding protein